MTEKTSIQGNGKIFRILAGFVIAVIFVFSLWVYPQLPERVPTHWNAAGEVNGYSSSFKGAFFIPGLAAGIWLLFLVIPKIDPRRANFKQMDRVFWLFSFVVVLFLGVLHVGTLLTSIGVVQNSFIPTLSLLGVGFLFIVLGNYMGKVKYNYTFGIRTPWTLANEEVWYKTHRAAGPFWMVGGIILMILGFLPSTLAFTIMMCLILGLALGTTVYSYIVFRRINK